MSWRINDLLAQAASELQPASPTPRLDAEVLLADLVGQERGWLLAHPEWRAPDPLVRAFARRLADRLAGQPVAYLTGIKEFFGLPLMVSPDVLIPRPTTELLVEAIQSRWSPTDGVVTDIGTGSGAIALALAAQRPRQPIIATDTSLAALRLAAANARRLGLRGRVDWRHGSLLTPVESEQLGLIVANLPYLTPDQQADPALQSEPAMALVGGSDGLVYLDRLLAQAAERNDWSGLVLECSPFQARKLRRQAEARWPEAELLELSDGRAVRGLAVWRD